MSHLVTVEELATELASGAPPRLLDVRWRLNEPEGRPAYLSSHIPGAVYVDLERELSRLGHPEEGRYPLPDTAQLEQTARRWGLNDGDRVVVYDDNDGVAAARAWWLLRGHGVLVRLLDGGFPAWLYSGNRLARGDHSSAPGGVSLGASHLHTVSIDEVASADRPGSLVDVRAPQQYRGQVSGLEADAGHIPGAINIPTVTHIDSRGRLLPPDRIRETLRSHGLEPGVPVTVYCNNGIASAHSALAFESAGYRPQLYPGGWSQWSRSPGRPIAIGRTPADVIVAA
ncbi:sulfurtransferase [Microbacterium sp. NPDC079995]|uniref:sulfurtransferase n=1 Tax=unclassified Microbacterium TaxID=2609290 RepID=UPI00344E310D